LGRCAGLAAAGEELGQKAEIREAFLFLFSAKTEFFKSILNAVLNSDLASV
jgi:hypothetical protein